MSDRNRTSNAPRRPADVLIVAGAVLLGMGTPLLAQTAGGDGGSGAGGGGGRGGQFNQPGGDAAPTVSAGGGGGGGGPTLSGAAQPGGSGSGGGGGQGGAGGINGYDASTGLFSPTVSYIGGNGSDGTNPPGANASGGGGGAAGYGAILPGTGTFGTSAAITGGDGGTGGTAANAGGGSGGDGGVGLYLPGGSFTAGSGAAVSGGNGGQGGQSGVTTGRGGNGGQGIFLSGSASLTMTAGATVRGGQGGQGGSAAASPTNVGDSGGGGAGILATARSTVTNSGAVQGGRGGDAPGGAVPNQNAYGSGTGGAGIVLMTGASLLNNAGGTIAGGSGGANANGAGGVSAFGGDGGAGVSGAAATIINAGSITGGSGGPTNTGDPVGFGASAIQGSDLTVINSGSLAPGLDGDGSVSSAAVYFSGGTNRFQIQAGSTVTGDVLAFSTADVLAFGGAADQTFNGSSIGSTGQYQGFGSVEKVDGGTTTITGTSTYAVPTRVLGGTLTAGNAGAFSQNSAFMVASGGTLNLGGFAQAINTVALAGGTLRNGALTGAVASTGGAIDALGGPATLTTTGGTTTATGVNTYTGATNVNGGTLAVIGSITASNITVNNGGTLAGTGKIGDPAINGGGTLAPGSAANPTGTLTIVGPLSFAAGSTYQVNITPTANSRTNVTGTTTIGGGTVNVRAGSGTYSSGARYTILTATGGVTGQFTNLQATTNLAFLTASLSYDANDVFLNLSAGPKLSSAALTSNQFGVATALASLPADNPLLTALLNQDLAGARQAFNALSGEVHSSEVTSLFETAFMVETAILDRLRGFTPATGLGLAGAEVAASFAADLPGGRKPELAAVPFSVLDPRVFALWGQGFGSFGSTRTNGNAATLTRDTGGFVIGADATLEGQYRIGVAGGFTDTNLDVRSRASTGEVTSGFGALYGAARFGALNLRIGGVFAGNSTKTTRNVSFPGFSDSLSAHFGGNTLQGFGEVGYQLPLGAAVLEPFVGAAVIHINRDGFTERGGPAALTVFARDYDVETITAGLRASMAFAPGSPFSLHGLLGYRHAFGDVVPTTLLAFAAGSSQFSTAGVPIDRDAVVAEAGIDWKVAPDVTLGLSYSGQAGGRANDNGVKGSFLYRF